ncbi:epoxide hydrolase [Herbiconiux sp. CPCC 205763]|uniref:Epoxide hydrolase n=1 Tax=Herbiconiux aconitum TaxID=2970913 RepID=A0ABT2GU66_9MICO|nr:epoxide hydrolase family protein [Herbiconiux aconitum]MCS5719756.1 epoxide hydrolase [Herbiconiux aconitum]
MTQPENTPPAEVPAERVADLKHRLERFRSVDVAGTGWERGVDPDFLRRLVAYWASGYDWREHEQRIRALGWQTAGRSTPIRLVHRFVSPDAPTVLLLHGWPDSVLRFERVLPLLSDVNLVIPALPGFPFALPLAEGGLPSNRMAEVVAAAMTDLGYERYLVSGGDIGSDVAEAIARIRPESVSALHLADVSQRHALDDPPKDPSEAERAYLGRVRDWQHTEGGYMREQATKPQTLAVGLGDSPAGLAAWILEKLRSWSDNDGELTSVFTLDELLTWISAYWFEGSIGTSFVPYAGPARGDEAQRRVETPVAVSIFPKDPVNPGREFAERYLNVQSWEQLEHGGHFSAWERPDDYVRGVRAALTLAAAR